MSKSEKLQKEIHITEEELIGKHCLYIATKRQGCVREFVSINVRDLESIVVTTDKTIALELFNGN